MKRSVLFSSMTAWCCLGLVAPVAAAPPPVTVAATNPSPGNKGVSAPSPAKVCLTDIRAFNEQLQKDGYWVGGSAYGYGYPLDGYGYGYAYPTSGDPAGTMNQNRYQNARSGYEIRNLIASANILG